MAYQDLVVADRSGRVELARDYRARAVVRNPGDAEAVKAGGLTLIELCRFLDDMQTEPAWRKLADRCCDYYDNKQLDSEILQLMEQRGVPPLICNMIYPTINAVLGMQAKNKRDWLVTIGDDGADEMLVKAINKKLNVAERESKSDAQRSEAFAAQVKAGLGWVEVGRESNPMRDSMYRVNYVHRREIWWDWRNRDPENWRYLVRKKWYDEDQLVETWPQFAGTIRGTCRGWPGYMIGNTEVNFGFDNTGLSDQLEASERAFTVSEHEWRDTSRRRAVLFEVWYRRWKRGLVFRLPNYQTIEFDERNVRHVAAYQAGAISPFTAVYPQVRQSVWIGPHRMWDRKSPYPHNHFPYVPLFANREDTTEIPYGLIRTMISPQDEINARRSRIQALQGSRRVEMDDDALHDQYNNLDDVAEEVSRADSFVVLNKNRKNGPHAFKITDNGDLSAPQFQMLQESKNEIHEQSGIFPSMLGSTEGARSGIAINSLVEQSVTTLAKINENYANADQQVGKLLLSLVLEDSMHEHAVAVGEGKTRTSVYLNRQTGVDEYGEPIIENDISQMRPELELKDVPSTPTYRQQQFAQLAEITKSLPPQAQAFVIDFVIEATDHPDRKKMAKRLRALLGIPEDGVEGGEQDPALQQQAMQYEQVIQELGAKLEGAMAAIQQLKTGADVKALDIQTKADTADKDRASEERIAQAELELERERMAQEKTMAFLEALDRSVQQEADERAAKEKIKATAKK